MEMFSNPIGLAAGLSLCAHAKAVHHQPQAMISFRLVPTLANGKPIRGVRPFELIGTPNSDLITSWMCRATNCASANSSASRGCPGWSRHSIMNQPKRPRNCRLPA